MSNEGDQEESADGPHGGCARYADDDPKNVPDTNNMGDSEAVSCMKVHVDDEWVATDPDSDIGPSSELEHHGQARGPIPA